MHFLETDKRDVALDFIKAGLIIFVILGHSFVPNTIVSGDNGISKLAQSNLNINQAISAITTNQAVPLFLLILGITFSLSFNRHNYYNIIESLNKKDIISRYFRLLIPYCLVLSILLLIAVLLDKIDLIYFIPNMLFGYLPVNGPGNYFISLVFQFIIAFPFIYFLNKKYPIQSYFIIFGIAIAYESAFSQYSFSYNFIFRYLPFILIGISISKGKIIIKQFVCLAPLSLIFLLINSQLPPSTFIYGIRLDGYSSTMIFLSAFWTYALFVIGYAINPRSWKVIRIFANVIGKNTWGIFLWQIAFFGLLKITPMNYSSFIDVIKINNIIYIIFVVLMCVIPGIVIESFSRKIIHKYKLF